MKIFLFVLKSVGFSVLIGLILGAIFGFILDFIKIAHAHQVISTPIIMAIISGVIAILLSLIVSLIMISNEKFNLKQSLLIISILNTVANIVLLLKMIFL